MIPAMGINGFSISVSRFPLSGNSYAAFPLTSQFIFNASLLHVHSRLYTRCAAESSSVHYKKVMQMIQCIWCAKEAQNPRAIFWASCYFIVYMWSAEYKEWRRRGDKKRSLIVRSSFILQSLNSADYQTHWDKLGKIRKSAEEKSNKIALIYLQNEYLIITMLAQYV